METTQTTGQREEGRNHAAHPAGHQDKVQDQIVQITLRTPAVVTEDAWVVPQESITDSFKT